MMDYIWMLVQIVVWKIQLKIVYFKINSVTLVGNVLKDLYHLQYPLRFVIKKLIIVENIISMEVFLSAFYVKIIILFIKEFV